MALSLAAVRIAAADPGRLAGFWAGVLAADILEQVSDGGVCIGPLGAGPALLVERDGVPKAGQNRIHLDLTTTSQDDLEATVALALELGGRHVDIGQTPADRHVVLADPEGNELCVIEPDNGFLADTGRIGAVNCDGSRAVGHFWSRALTWPLVWDQDEETAIQSPAGGAKVTWSGPPLMARPERDRLRLELAVTDGSDLSTEVGRLVGLGARHRSGPEGDDRGRADVVRRVLMTDLDGNEFGVTLA